MMLLLMMACGQADECTSDPASSPAGIALTAQEHPGWGSPDCASCHAVGTYHQRDCMAQVELDLDALDGPDCSSCHGDNGVRAQGAQDSGR